MVGTVKISYPKKTLLSRIVGDSGYYIDEKSRLITTHLWIGPHPRIAKSPGHFVDWDNPKELKDSHIPDCEKFLFDDGVELTATDIFHQSENGIIWRLLVGGGRRVFVNELYHHLFIALHEEHLQYRQLKADGPITVEWVTGIIGQLMPGHFEKDPLAVLGLPEGK